MVRIFEIETERKELVNGFVRGIRFRDDMAGLSLGDGRFIVAVSGQAAMAAMRKMLEFHFGEDNITYDIDGYDNRE